MFYILNGRIIWLAFSICFIKKMNKIADRRSFPNTNYDFFADHSKQCHTRDIINLLNLQVNHLFQHLRLQRVFFFGPKTALNRMELDFQ